MLLVTGIAEITFFPRGCVHSTYADRGEGGQAIVINFITVQGEGGKKAKDLCMYYVNGPLARGCLVFFASICSLQDSTK